MKSQNQIVRQRAGSFRQPGRTGMGAIKCSLCMAFGLVVSGSASSPLPTQSLAAQSVSVPNPAETRAIHVYFPLHDGDTRNYSRPEVNFSLSVYRTTFQGQEVFAMGDSYDTRLYYSSTDTELLMLGTYADGIELVFDSPLVEIDENLILNGGTRTSRTTLSVEGIALNLVFTVTVKDAATVTTPAGKFDNCRLLLETFAVSAPGHKSEKTSQAFVLAPGVGQIRISQVDNVSRFIDLASGSVDGVDINELAPLTNPFGPVKGTFNGLFYDKTRPTHESAGSLSLALTDRGKFTGKIQQGRARYAFSGQLGFGLSAEKRISRPSMSDLVVDLQVGPNGVTGAVSDATWSSDLFAYRSAFDSRTNPATTYQGNYTVLLPGAATASEGPMGHGFACLTVNSAGRLSLKATLGDNIAAVQSGSLAVNGQWPLYLPLYAGKGSVFGWLTLTGAETNDLSGSLLWIKPAGLTGPICPGGFTNEILTLGSRYIAPLRGSPVMDCSSGVLALAGGSLDARIAAAFTMDAKNKITFTSPNPNKLALTVSAPGGTFKGSFVHPRTGKPSQIKGVILQKQDMGCGLFLGADQSGTVHMGEQ